MEKTSRQSEQESAKVNYWKWAFISLIAVLVLSVILLLQAIRPINSVEDSANKTPIDPKGEIEMVSELSKEDVEFILNSFLEVESKDSPASYQVKLDEELELASKIEWMGLRIPFLLTFEPYATEDGNLQLRAQSVELASFSLPVSAIMAALGNQMNLPTFIQLDSESQMILVDFNQLHNFYPYGIELEKVDLENDEIQLKLFVNKATLKRALDSEKKESGAID